jgi:hypothetical protein
MFICALLCRPFTIYSLSPPNLWNNYVNWNEVCCLLYVTSNPLAMYIVFIIACSASGQAHFQSPALQQLQTQVWYFNIVLLHGIYIAIYYTKQILLFTGVVHYSICVSAPQHHHESHCMKIIWKFCKCVLKNTEK